MSFSACSALRRLDKQARRAEFRLRQAVLAATAVAQMALWLACDEPLFLAIAMLVIKTGSVEALRFRRAGTVHQTRRTVWRGSTPEDVRARWLLQGWRPWNAQP